MSEPIGPGDWVECIEADWSDDGARIEIGRIYQVLGVYPGTGCRSCGCGSIVIDLVGQVVREDSGWCTCQFRPIYRKRDADALIQSLKTPAKAPTKEPA